MKGARATARPSSDDRRAAMLEIARAAFLREGYAAASMAEIAAKIGGSKATLYSYFPSKKDLFAAVIEEEVRRMFVAPVRNGRNARRLSYGSRAIRSALPRLAAWPRIRSLSTGWSSRNRRVFRKSDRPPTSSASSTDSITLAGLLRRRDGAGRAAAGGRVGRGGAIHGFVLRESCTGSGCSASSAPTIATKSRSRRGTPWRPFWRPTAPMN